MPKLISNFLTIQTTVRNRLFAWNKYRYSSPSNLFSPQSDKTSHMTARPPTTVPPYLPHLSVKQSSRSPAKPPRDYICGSILFDPRGNSTILRHFAVGERQLQLDYASLLRMALATRAHSPRGQSIPRVALAELPFIISRHKGHGTA